MVADMAAHGGDVWQVAREHGIPAGELLDFSANINPRGLPLRARERLARDASDPHLLSCYPDPTARVLRAALGARTGVPPEAIAVGPGAESLLAPVLRCVQAKSLLVPVPAFSEYRRVCEQAEIALVPFSLDRAESFRVPVESLCEHAGVVLLNNPHNPSGALLEAREVLRIAEAAETLIVDEAFIDYASHASVVREASVRRGLIVIRSLTKFYGCPALRVGYAVAHPDTIRKIQGLLPTWPVTQLALDAIAESVTDCEYAEASLRENAVERERLTASLTGLGLMVVPSAANYLLLELGEQMPASSDLRSRLIAKHRILIRNCDSYEGLAQGRYVRVAVRSPTDTERLIRALTEELR
jgi:threonine-phosphate decarboxylase